MEEPENYFIFLNMFPKQMESEEVSILGSHQHGNIEMSIASEENDIIPATLHLSCNSICAFSKEENDNHDLKERSKSSKKLVGLIIFYFIVMTAEIIGGLKANSLAIFTDAAHLLTDIAGSCVSLFAIWASGWEVTSQQSFGFSRLEVLGALVQVQLIWMVSAGLMYEAIDRIRHQNSPVNGRLMFATAAFGFIVNLIMIIWLGHDHSHHTCHDHNHSDHHTFHDHNHSHHHTCHDHEVGTSLVSSSEPRRKILNINIEGAYLHVMADLIQTLGIMIAGGIIWLKPEWLVVDLISTLIFSGFVFCTTIPMLRNAFGILMEGTPCEINVGNVESGLKCIEGVEDVHDLHIWAITAGKLVLTCHVVAHPRISSAKIREGIKDYCQKTYGIRHATVQIEQ